MKYLTSLIVAPLIAGALLSFNAASADTAQQANVFVNAFAEMHMNPDEFFHVHDGIQYACPAGKYKTGYQFCACIDHSDMLMRMMGDYFPMVRMACEHNAAEPKHAN